MRLIPVLQIASDDVANYPAPTDREEISPYAQFCNSQLVPWLEANQVDGTWLASVTVVKSGVQYLLVVQRFATVRDRKLRPRIAIDLQGKPKIEIEVHTVSEPPALPAELAG